VAEDAGNGESVESYYRQHTGAVRGGAACGGDGGTGCGCGGYGVCGDCAVSEDWGLSAVYCRLFGEVKCFISATSTTTASGLECTRIALGTAEIMLVEKARGYCNMYGKPLHITYKAVAGNLILAVQLLMGEAGECYLWSS